MKNFEVGKCYFVKNGGKLQELLLIKIDEIKDKFSGFISHKFHFESENGNVIVSKQFIVAK